MSLNIKNKETHRLVRALALFAAEAVRERLERLRCEKGQSLADRMLAIGRDCAAHLKEPFRSVEHGELLYDERGLPR